MAVTPDDTTKAERNTGTCKHCGQGGETFLYAYKADPPWWYMVAHDHAPGTCPDGELCAVLCPGSGFPSEEQEEPW